jgi:hypothetical protein
VSPDAPPLNVKPGVDVLVEYKYTLALTVIVISDVPAEYPPIVVTFNDALAVVDE